MFCAVADGMSFMNHPHQIMGIAHLTIEMMEKYLDHYLLVAHMRYRQYLDVLVKEKAKGTPTNTWPVPPWYGVDLEPPSNIARAYFSRDVALMMHTHMLHPVHFQQDLAVSMRYNTLAGLVDFPLIMLDYKSRHPSQQGGNVVMELLSPTTFPPKMNIAFLYLPTSYKLTARPPPFSIDPRAAAKRQVAFARKITTSVYPYDPVPENLLLDSQQRYAKFINLIRMNQNPAFAPG
jgi:hypothetical protein